MSRDVIFYESIFPFAKNNSVENLNVLPNEANEEATEIPFEINHQDFITTDAYNPDQVDLPDQFFMMKMPLIFKKIIWFLIFMKKKCNMNKNKK